VSRNLFLYFLLASERGALHQFKRSESGNTFRPVLGVHFFKDVAWDDTPGDSQRASFTHLRMSLRFAGTVTVAGRVAGVIVSRCSSRSTPKSRNCHSLKIGCAIPLSPYEGQTPVCWQRA